jgi:hypothetical protein
MRYCDITFSHGPYNEIFAPPLLAGVSEDEALRKLYAVSLSLGSRIDLPKNKTERKYLVNRAMIFWHQMRLRQVISGTAKSETEIEQALREAVQAGEPLSIRPLGREKMVCETFAPVLRRLDGDTWQFGVPGQGKVITFQTPPGKVIETAQQTYVEWREAEL